MIFNESQKSETLDKQGVYGLFWGTPVSGGKRNGVQEAGGSNPLTQTKIRTGSKGARFDFVLEGILKLRSFCPMGVQGVSGRCGSPKTQQDIWLSRLTRKCRSQTIR